MPTIRAGDFEWDAAKAAINVRKHGIAFEEAMTVFLDELAVPFQDVVHSERLVLVGHSSIGRILLVIFTERMPGGILRIISARRASKRERRAYEEEQ